MAPTLRRFDPSDPPGYVNVLFDDAGSHVGINWEHYQVHEGKTFTAEHSASVGNGSNLDLLLETGQKEVHIVLAIAAGGQCSISLYEAPTDVSAGTSVPVYNMNRRSQNAAQTTVKHSPTVTNPGSTALISGRLLAGGNTFLTRVGSAARHGTEFMLKAATKYLLRVNNSSGSTIPINALVEWYEQEE